MNMEEWKNGRVEECSADHHSIIPTFQLRREVELSSKWEDKTNDETN